MADLLDELRADEDLEADRQREIRSLRSKLDQTSAEKRELQKMLDFALAIDQAKLRPAKWLRKPTKGGNRGIVTLQLTDTHFDEVVIPSEVDFINAYNREIAEGRLKRWAEKSIVLARDFIKGIDYDGAVLLVTGDILSGDIHEELENTNEGSNYESALHWMDRLSSAIDMLATEFGKLHVAVTYGNHGRDSKKPRFKRRAAHNIEWLMFRWLEREFRIAGKTHVTFQVSDAMDTTVDVYSTKYLITHGDQFKGGTGISGMLAPLMLGQHRKTMRQMYAGHPFDYLVMGHFHQYFPPGKGLVVGGSMKGYDEYAYGHNLKPEPAQQAFWITSPEYGPTLGAPVHVQDRKLEGW